MSKQKQPVMECIVHEWKPFIDAMKHETWKVCLNCGARVVDGVQTQEGKSLTAWENIKYVFGEWLKSQESISFTADSWNAYCAGFKYHEQETASLREELEVVKKERNGSVEIRDNSLGYLKICQEELIRVTRQRDELQAALDEIANPIRYMKSRLRDGEQIDGHYAVVLSKDDHYLKGIAEKALSRLSSGETKPVREKERNECEQERDRAIWLLSRYLEYAESGCIQGMEDDELSEETRNFLNGNALPVSPWISVEERLPEESGRYMCYVKELTDLGFTNYAWNCSYSLLHGFTDNLRHINVTHWMPLPAPPESLTDKK